MKKEVYRGWTIEEDTELWSKLFGSKVKFYLDGERVYSASSKKDAKEQIDEIGSSSRAIFKTLFNTNG